MVSLRRIHLYLERSAPEVERVESERAVIQVLFSFDWSDTLTSVSWVATDGNVWHRVVQGNGAWFERPTDHTTLGAVWRDESLYSFYRPVLVSHLRIAFRLLGRSIDFLDNFPPGPLEPEPKWGSRAR